MICYGVVDAICSFAFGRLVQFVGHAPFFLLGKISEMQSIIVFIKKRSNMWSKDGIWCSRPFQKCMNKKYVKITILSSFVKFIKLKDNKK